MNIKVGDKIIFKNSKKDEEYEVAKIEGGLIWYKIKYGIGQTIQSSIEKVIKPKKKFIKWD